MILMINNKILQKNIVQQIKIKEVNKKIIVLKIKVMNKINIHLKIKKIIINNTNDFNYFINKFPI